MDQEAPHPHQSADRSAQNDLDQVRLLIADGNAREALPLMGYLSRTVPGGAFWSGLVYLDLQRYSEALSAFDYTLASNPEQAWALSSRSYTLAALRRYDEAIWASRLLKTVSAKALVSGVAQVEELLARNDQYQYGWYSKGSLVFAQRRPTPVLFAQECSMEALGAFERALALNPGDTSAWNDKGVVLSSLNYDEEALLALEQAIGVDPQNAAAWMSKAIGLCNLKRCDEALSVIEHALTVDPAFVIAWIRKGHILHRLKRYEEALAAYEHALTLDPQNETAWSDKIRLLRRQWRFAEARAAKRQWNEAQGLR